VILREKDDCNIVKTPGSQKDSPAAAEEGAEGMGGGRGEGGERR